MQDRSFDLGSFDLASMARLTAALRKLGDSAGSMEEAATRITQHLRSALVNASGASACVLVRLFRTHPYGDLPTDLQEFARDCLPGSDSTRSRCLTLLGTAGELPDWNDRRLSLARRAIPLVPEAVARIPMLAGLASRLGIRTVVGEPPFRGSDVRASKLFHVEDASLSDLIPAKDFVARFGVRSVLGVGGAFRTGEAFAMILFTTITIDEATASLFEPFAVAVKLALAPHEQKVFT